MHSHIGYGAPHKQDSPEAHGEPLGEEEVRLTKQFFGFDPAQDFVVPDGVREHFAAQIGARGAQLNGAWQDDCSRATAPSIRTSPSRSTASSKRALPTGMGSGAAGLPAERDRAFDARRVRQGAERGRRTDTRGSSAARRTWRPAPRRG